MSRPEPKPPAFLQQVQGAFANSIRTPLLIDDEGDYAYQTHAYAAEASEQMLPSSHLDGLARLQVYNQQYWFRLLSVLQGECPLTRARLGLLDFNRLAQEYLSAVPSTAKELHHLPEGLPGYLARPECRWRQPGLAEAAELDLIYSRLFFAAEHAPFDGASLEAAAVERLLSEPLPFQSAWFLYHDTTDAVSQRHQAVMASEDLRLFAGISDRRWVLYRSLQGRLVEEELEPVQYLLLQQLRVGAHLPQAIQAVLEAEPEAATRLLPEIGTWFRRWAALAWFRAR